MALTAAQIVTLACQTAKTISYTAQAGQFLNSILSDLCQTYDFEIIVKTFSFNFNLSTVSGPGNQYIAGCGPNPMPADYLRAKNREMIYYIQGVRYIMINQEQEDFDALVQQAGQSSYPSFFYVDMGPVGTGSVPNMYCWVPASGAYPVTVRYYPQMPDIATPETSSTVPWFPNQRYLLKQLSGMMMELANDDRAPEYLGNSPSGAEGILRKYLELKDDPEGRVKRVQLDRRLFGTSWNRLPNTKTIGW